MRIRKERDFKSNVCVFILAVLLSVFIFGFHLTADQNDNPASLSRIEEKVKELMEEGDIPGLSLVIIKADEPVYVEGFGYADLEEKKPVTPDTLFELASTSKAFTALAALKCEADGLLDLDEPVSSYLPWFSVNYRGQVQKITLRQVLHQTSGIPFKSTTSIPVSSSKDALEQTVRNIKGIELNNKPGEAFEYATINYDIIGAVIEAVSGMSYEDYMEKQVLSPLGLNHSRVGVSRLQPEDLRRMATGYKIGFFRPIKYQAPVFRGNNPAGYVISNGRDMARWLQLQLGMVENEFTTLIQKTHQRDQSVPPQLPTFLSYAMGWMVTLDGSGVIMHSGLNPNFTAHVVFNPEDKTGVAVLANSNSNYTAFIGRTVLNLLYGKETPMPANLGGGMDKGSSLISFFLVLFLLGVAVFLVFVFIGILKGRRKFEPIDFKRVLKLAAPFIFLIPFLLAVYLLPWALAGFSWGAALVWSPISFRTAITLLLIAMGSSYVGYFISTLFPHQNKYLRSLPMLIILSLGSGGANAVIIFLISISLFSKTNVGYLVFYFCLAGLLYITGRKVLQTRLIKITNSIIYDLRMKLVERIFYTSYQRFEKLEGGRILATLNNDTGQIGQSANLFVILISSIVTVIGAFIYLATIAFWATIVTLIVVALIATIYYIVSQKANVYFNEARNTQNEWMELLTDLQDGFKELSLHRQKKIEFKGDVQGICAQFRDKLINALVRFVNAFMIGESMLIAVLGAVGFLVPILFPEIETFTLMGFIMVLLYLIGPVNGILNSIPGIMQIRIAWERVNQFMKDIPANMTPEDLALIPGNLDAVQRVEARRIFFEYKAEEEEEKFSVGPLDFEINKGEIVFIIGGNGSGKTTLAKLLTGLYIPEQGTITVDGKEINNYQLGEYFSVVFGDYHLFEKLYDVELTDKDKLVEEYLRLLRLEKKVTLEGGSFSTLDLSGGQRKRLALLRCYLEDRPVYLFDEVAADQDPEFRKFFYRELLKRMKEKGKMVIAITHDDHYFDVADRVVKMDMGQIDLIEDGASYTVTR